MDRFKQIELTKDLGHYVWSTVGEATENRNLTAEQVLQHIVSPDDAVASGIQNPKTISRPSLPVSLPNLRAPTYPNLFPMDPGYIVPLRVARDRGVDLSTVDFMLGGSALNVLAEQNTSSTTYVFRKVGRTIVLGKRNAYEKDFGKTGFRFERLLTGEATDDVTAPAHSFESLRLLRIGPFRVLVSADIDAQTEDGIVEIKSGNPRYFGTKLMFQMMSSGASELHYAIKNRNRITGVARKSFAEMVPSDREIEQFERKIISSLERLLELSELSELSEQTMGIRIDGSRQTTYRVTGFDADLLPLTEVIRELLFRD